MKDICADSTPNIISVPFLQRAFKRRMRMPSAVLHKRRYRLCSPGFTRQTISLQSAADIKSFSTLLRIFAIYPLRDYRYDWTFLLQSFLSRPLNLYHSEYLLNRSISCSAMQLQSTIL